MIEPEGFIFEAVPISHRPLIKQFYKHAGYHSQVGRKEEVYCLRDKDKQIVAAVRLVKTADYLILRSMVVRPDARGQGLGHYFLQQITAKLAQRVCWCYPFEWLEDFYASAGFIRIQAENAPLLIHTNYQQYREQGRKILIMRYPSSA